MWGNMKQGEDMKISCILEIPELIEFKALWGILTLTHIYSFLQFDSIIQFNFSSQSALSSQ